MVNVNVVVYGKELQTPITTTYEISVFGKVNTIVFLQNDCEDLLTFEENEANEYKTILFTGNEIETVLRTPETIVFVGKVETVAFVNNKRDIIHTYKLNSCDSKEPFSEVKP